jgi:hypothetical protein
MLPVGFWLLFCALPSVVTSQRLSGLDLTIPIPGASEACRDAMACEARCSMTLGIASEDRYCLEPTDASLCNKFIDPMIVT